MLERKLSRQGAAHRAPAVAQPHSNAKPHSDPNRDTDAHPDAHSDANSSSYPFSHSQRSTHRIAGRMSMGSTLYLLRHAKSSWADDSLPDRDRPLTRRGRRAAQRLAQHFHEHGIAPELVLCSPALRTRQTLELIEPGLHGRTQVLVEDELYGAGAEQLLLRLRRLPGGVDSALLIGHNPGVQDLAVLLVHGGTEREQLRTHFPTAALATLAITEGWARLGRSGARLVDFRVPRGRG